MKQKSLFLTIAVLLGLRITTTAQTPPSYVPTDGLVGWWPFNGNANDESGNGNNGTVNGATLTEDRFGMGNMAYNFNGFDQQIEVVDDSSLDFTNNYSVSLWYNVYDLNQINQGALGKANYSGGTGYQVLINGGLGDAIQFGYNNSPVPIGEVTINGGVTTPLAAPYNSGWHHIVGTYDGALVKLYVDGIFITEVEEVFSLTNSEQPLLFGNESNILSRYFDGDLDDIGLWNRALTQEEITDLYNANLCYEYITVTDTLIINLGPMGFNPVTYQNTILMYPNPTNDQLTIDYGNFTSLAGYTLKIFNSMGQETHSANISQQQEVLPLGTWGGAGNYQVVIYNAQGVPVDTRTIVLQ
jgi:hypothetical protein